MAQTAEALAKIPFDRFERLASAVLRRANPLYERLIHTGMNTDGQTVKSPVDGICPVPGSRPPHFVLFHYTADERRERKWLHERTPSGEGSRTPDGELLPDPQRKTGRPLYPGRRRPSRRGPAGRREDRGHPLRFVPANTGM